MKNIKLYAKCLERFSLFVLLPSYFLGYFYYWFIDGSDILEKYSKAYSCVTETGMKFIPTVSRAFVLFLDIIPMVVLFIAFFLIIKIFKCYGKGEFFSQKTFYLFKKISMVSFIWVVLDFLTNNLKSLAITYFNPIGHRILSFSVSTDDLINIFIVGFLFILTSLMYEGYKLKKDQDLTV